VAPTAEQVTAALDAAYDATLPDTSGATADYIPELATADPTPFALALTGVSGRRYAVGDADTQFTLQSVTKPFVLALAIADRGLDEVLAHVGAEPSGDAFNAISLDPATGVPANPMINAGAIATTALVRGADDDERFARILALLSAFAGRPLVVDEAVLASEAATADRNRALAHLMRAAGSLDAPAHAAVDTYLRQCAVLATTGDLATMAATLATGGVNPVSGERVVAPDVARHVQSVMATCGMYDYSGRWMLRVGLPAKSGVAGGLLAVNPGRFGVGAFSPRLDAQGNTVRGVAALKRLVADLGLHPLHDPMRHN
jgi:glutaminase